jgi:hypothetical protein
MPSARPAPAQPSPHRSRRRVVRAAWLVVVAVALGVAPVVACTSGTTPDCSDAQCGTLGSEADQSLGDDSAQDAPAQDGSQEGAPGLPEAAPDHSAPPADSGDAGAGTDSDAGKLEGGDSAPKDAPSEG